jgi:HORMA domain-containing protein
MTTYTYSASRTFTITHARHIAAKVATDLKRVRRLYGEPGDAQISEYEAEVVAFMKAGYLGSVTYGFRRHGEFIPPTLFYTASQLGISGQNDDPGRIRPGYDVTGASFYSFLLYSPAWYNATDGERKAFKATLPFQRVSAEEPSARGYQVSDRHYSAGGHTLSRSTLHPI